jgi:formate/nitrite transporter FocA (FNT family)
MDYAKPSDVVAAMVDAGMKKLALGPRDLLIRGALSGALLIAATWLPIFTFFALGFEHTVVNMFIIPAGMMLGAKVSVWDRWVWNQIPVTLGNLVGGFVFTGLALYTTFKPAEQPTPAPSVAIQAAAE